mmetsp:Transcript_26038/g.39009  ORF Transcript_26038/g.39009 Transcript_26038/m.39009 type:complete len:372 (-) Transcript_26038:963-2078(-)
MGTIFSHTAPQTLSPLFQPAIDGDAALLKTLIGRYIADYVNSEPMTSKYDPKLQSYVNSSGDVQGNNAVIAATFGGYLDIVEFLVNKCGADITIKNNMGCSPIWIAAGYSKVSILEFFINHITMKEGETKAENLVEILSETNNTGDSPFLAAASKGHLDVCQMLFQAILNQHTRENDVIDYQPCWKLLTHKNKAGDTPLSVVVGNGLEGEGSLLCYLLDKEEDCLSNLELRGEEVIERPLNAKNSKGLTPLMVACERNNVLMVKELIKRGAIITYDSNGRSPLAIASFCGCLDVAQHLLSLDDGISLLNKTDSNNCTPLWLAARTGNVKMVKLLMDSGADDTITDSGGFSARSIAEKFKKDRVVDYFTQSE